VTKAIDGLSFVKLLQKSFAVGEKSISKLASGENLVVLCLKWEGLYGLN